MPQSSWEHAELSFTWVHMTTGTETPWSQLEMTSSRVFFHFKAGVSNLDKQARVAYARLKQLSNLKTQPCVANSFPIKVVPCETSPAAVSTMWDRVQCVGEFKYPPTPHHHQHNTDFTMLYWS